MKNAPPALTSDLTRATKAALLASAPVTKPRPGSQPAVTTHTSPAPAPSRKSPASVALAAAMPVQPLPTFDEDAAASGERLARVTAYWRDEGDYYTGRCLSATGVRLHDGHCAVDPNIIPYGSVVDIKGVGTFLAVDTGSAVISRTAAREGGQTSAQRHAIVVDLFFASRREGERFAASDAKFVSIRWWTPGSTGTEARAARRLFAEEDWTKIQSKQL